MTLTRMAHTSLVGGMMQFDLTETAGRFPNRVTLELTNRCNLNCVFCPRCYMEKERGTMDVGLAKALISEMAGHAPVTLVPFFRGESLLHPQWHEIIGHAVELAVGEVQFTTNASLLTPERAERLLDLNLGFISFSLDTLDVELYNASRRGADFDTTLSNVLNFLKRHKERGSNTMIQVSSVETPNHKPGMAEFVDYWKPKVDRVRVYAEHSAQGELGRIDQELPAFEKRLPCKKPFTDMVVLWDGDVACCNHDWARKIHGPALGNVAPEGIARVWGGDKYQEFRRAHRSGYVADVSPCADCDHWKMYYLKEGFLGRTYSRKSE